MVSFLAGIQNALAGGGSFLTLPTLMFTGLNARAANITSTIALFPGQITTGLAGKKHVSDLPRVSFKVLFLISLIGGIIGAFLLIKTPVKVFEYLVPWLVLFATLVFVWGSYFRKNTESGSYISPIKTIFSQFIIAIYGGYFGGGIGILMLAALTLSGLPVRNAGATKNVLAAVMNASAVAVFLFSKDIAWTQALVASVGAIIGGQVGAYVLHKVNEKILRAFIIILGFALAIGLFLKT
ncbi:protein of unknown function DUF81 [Thermodesulfobium narugense DSM 14796]|uniref:Probable membrane transporter protein n=1 Tax=Thermodesulfobium narugense DSM 14796 TaxID=747365 RepID=M1E801_9BACT|nr:sulfite exporter TauE/SafE family protein [Thermodesulfobium narugense]AEE14695.1 protein of unknown function DUF81 [Thermodesulfobium narugense DSM 14796]